MQALDEILMSIVNEKLTKQAKFVTTEAYTCELYFVISYVGSIINNNISY